MHPKTRSISFKLLLYFVCFTLVLLSLLWLLQVVFLQTFYQSTTIHMIEAAASDIQKLWNSDDPDYLSKLENIAFDNNICLEIDQLDGTPYYSIDMLGRTCLIHGVRSYALADFRQQVIDHPDQYQLVRTVNTRFDTEMLLYGQLLGEEGGFQAILLLNCALEPLSNTISILANQFIFVTIAVLLLVILVAPFIARFISRPIQNLTKSAQQLATGDFTVHFPPGGYTEVDQLAATLNYAADGLSKVEKLQRDLIANISHDLRTPLTTVKAYAEMVRDLSGDNPVKREQHLGVIIDETDRLSALVCDLLDLSKMQAGSLQLTLSPFDLGQTITTVMGRYDIYAQREGYVFHVDAPSGLMVNADCSRIQQVLYNLINNALNHTGKQDKQVFIEARRTPTGVYACVRDTGKGIPPEQLDLIWEQYYQTPSTARAKVGTGLGLSIVSNILNLHRARYGVESTVGQGSTFWFELDAASPLSLEKGEDTR